MTRNERFSRGKLRAGAALQALALIGAGVGVAAISTPAAAQDYTTGSVRGTVVDTAGKDVPGAQVTLTSQAQGQARTLTTSANGSFSAVGLAPGAYNVTVKAGDYGDLSDTITVAAAQENRVTLTIAPANQAADIVVTGQRVRQDFTKTTTGVNIDVPALTANVALPRSITAITLLAPGSVRGVAGFGDVPSLSGASVAENAYYVNGLNITNPDTYVGGAEVPFDFYKTVDVQTGGYAAEFGRATGGIINATTKSGSNTPFMAIHGNFVPSGTTARGPSIGDPTNRTSIGSLYRNDENQLSIEAGGALIKDHVFLYGLFADNRNITKSALPSAGNYETRKNTSPFFGGKADVYFTPTQHLEFTYFNTQAKTYITDYAITPNAQFTDATVGAYKSTAVNRTGGVNWVGRYTGAITDFFQISAAYGINKDTDDFLPGDVTSYFVRDQRSSTSPSGTTSTRVISASQTALTNQIVQTRREFYRVDGDLRFSLLGRHHVRFGMDTENVSESKITQINGTLPIRYTYTDTGVQLLYERLGGQVSGKNRAFYIQDSWEPADGLTINVGIRDDEFSQRNLSGQQYLNFKSNFGPRAGFSYVPNGTSNFKFTGSYGRYFIPPAMNLGFRGRDLYFAEYFNYPGATTAAQNRAIAGGYRVDQTTGLPLLALGSAQTFRTGAGYGSACPTSLAAAPGSPVNGAATCLVLGAGIQDPAFAKVAPGTKATYEDEVILGMRYQVTPLLSVGLTGTHRRLSRVSEDTDFAPIIADQLGCNGATPTGTAAQCNFYENNSTYYIWNPGKKSLSVRDWQDASKIINLTNLQFPTPKRKYDAVTLDWNRADDGVWSLQGSVTLSRLTGSTEGTVKSDAGNGAQTDAGSTSDFDYIGLTDYSYGRLANDRSWNFKLFGSVHLASNLIVGGNLQVQSPLPGSCEGIHPTDPYAAGYGAQSFFCAYGPLNAAGNYTATRPSPRGTGYRSDWLVQFDPSVRFILPEAWGVGKRTVLRADIFNVFNRQSVQQRYVQHETAQLSPGLNGEYVPDPLYNTPTVYQQPRYIRFGFDMSF
ncbi:TonB-dependent receptor [uncultured Sphingomonas sp.]|uniref:TonB-dependent receptor n=1 Tax=uncultured Sphingomonas sp. TaxID=158754 RepID=UPI0025DE12F9|nr:TonB-dependent receptor [uncultured Sphingomonas sp.]